MTLARALYSPAQVLLLDDILAALDVHTSKWVIENAFKGDIIRDRTIVLVTHNVALAAPIADHVIALGKNGKIASQGSMSEVLKKDASLRAAADKELEEVKKVEAMENEAKKDDETKKKAGKLVVAEEKAFGRAEWAAYDLFYKGFGGHLVFIFITFMRFIDTYGNVVTVWFLGYWAAQYTLHPASEVSALKYADPIFP